MTLQHLATTCLLAWCLTQSAHAQLTTRTGEGDSVKTGLGYGITLNDKSSLKRQWVAINDPNSPVELDGSTNVTVQHEKDYLYAALPSIKARQAISAVELIHVVLDVFGRRLNTLQTAEVADFAAGEVKTVISKWRMWSETEAKLAHTSFTYVRSVRTADGAIYFAPMSQVLDVIRKGPPSITVSDIEPKKGEPK